VLAWSIATIAIRGRGCSIVCFHARYAVTSKSPARNHRDHALTSWNGTCLSDPCEWEERLKMKMRAALLSIVLLGFLGVSPIVHAYTTSYDFDGTTDFSKFRTFALESVTPAVEPFLDRRIVAAIESELVARGLTKNESNPDLYVLHLVALGVQKTVTGSGSSLGPFVWQGGLDTFNARVNDIPVGALIIDVTDAAKRELVWRGASVNEIDVHAKPEQRDVAIVKAVKQILKKYPLSPRR
jgi:Domain of unknown function (DUF4136)